MTGLFPDTDLYLPFTYKPTKYCFVMKIVFFGTPEFAVPSLDRLVREGHEIAAVVTMPDKIAGRGHKLIMSDVKKYALEHELPILQPEKLKSPEFLEQLRSLDADLFVVIAFRMLPEAVWAMPPKGTFNLHAALLPKYRGAAPINRAIMNGETKTGVTTFFLNHEIDMGSIIDQREIPISDQDNVGTVYDRLMNLGADMVSETVRKIEAGDIHPKPQPEGEFVPAPKIFKEDCLIHWDRPAVEIHNQVRGLSPYPCAYAQLTAMRHDGMDTKIYTTRLTEEAVAHAKPGDVKVDGKRMLVATGDNWLEILELQPAGKKRMDTSAFLLGYSPIHFH